MRVQKMLSNIAAYNQWANDSLLKWLQAKPQELLHQEIPSSYASLIKTLNHILAVEEFWLSMISGQPMAGGARYLATTYDVAEIFASLSATSKQLVDYVAGLDEAALEQSIRLDLPWIQGELLRVDLIQHAFNHSTYHRGQLTTIGRNVGITDAPPTDYNVFVLSQQRVPA